MPDQHTNVELMARCNPVSNKIVILDRDGVINEDVADHVRRAADWQPIPGSLRALARLNSSGWTVAVATNQSGIGRGFLSLAALQRIHQTMCDAVEAAGGHLSTIVYCPHVSSDSCACRKPNVGMLNDIAHRLRVDLVGAPFIGDSLSDMQAAHRYGCTPILVRTGHGRAVEEIARDRGVQNVFDDLEEAVDWLVQHC